MKDLNMKEKLVAIDERIEDLRHSMYCLECGDDFLFSNRNGNLPRYRAMQEELSELSKQRQEIADAYPRCIT